MKATIEVKDRREAALVQTAMEDPAVRAFTIVMGALLQLPSDRARQRVLGYVKDKFEEDAAAAAEKAASGPKSDK
jgi:hypothetical protein